MATQNGNSCEHTNFDLNLVRMCLFAKPNAAEVKLITSLNAMKSVGIKHRSTWRVPKTSVWKKKTIRNECDTFFAKINSSALPFYTENLEI